MTCTFLEQTAFSSSSNKSRCERIQPGSMIMTEIALSEPISGVADNTLISAYLEGNEYAFEVLMNRYQDRLVNYVNRLIHDFDMSADLAQEAFIRVYRNVNRYQGQYQFSTWLYRIATNLAIDEMRRRERKGRVFFHNVMNWIQRTMRPIFCRIFVIPRRRLWTRPKN